MTYQVLFSLKKMKTYLWMSSAAVMTGTLRVNYQTNTYILRQKKLPDAFSYSEL